MKLSVVIPAYNEEENIQQAVEDVKRVYPEAEIIVVDDASTDNTPDILIGLQSSGVNILRNDRNRGHGYSVVKGLWAATGEHVLYIDADRQIDITNLHSMDLEHDVFSGARVLRKDKPFRIVISYCLKITNLLRHGMYIRDANCPFKLYRREALRELLKDVPDTFIVPIACMEVIARKKGMKIDTIGVHHLPYRGIRKGFLQSFNLKMYRFLADAFFEVVKL